MSAPGTVIVGAGQAGVQVALSLRELGYDKPITIFNNEELLPYQKPPLSKGFMMGKIAQEGLYLRNPDYFARAGISIVSEHVDAVDRAARKVIGRSGTHTEYEALVLATGSRNRALELPGVELDGVLSLRSFDDAAVLRERMGAARNVVVIGAGFIGLEFAAAASKSGTRVHVVEAASRPMARAVTPEVSTYFTQRHMDRGTTFSFGDTVQRIEGSSGRVVSVHTAQHEALPADLVLIGVGVIPNSELAHAAGLATDNGIIVDAHLVTSDPSVSAVGDCAVYPNAFSKSLLRVESVQNAVDHGRLVAARLTGNRTAYCAVPWFWSDQGEDKLQIAGISLAGDERFAKGDHMSGRFSVFLFRAGSLVCVESVNRVADHMAARSLLKSGRLGRVTPDIARSEDFDLKAYAAKEVAEA
ncbi:NAD(P)/FAD-dependent oxidoreductase [Bradyrhizobium sp. CCGUVB14]|uniref:NAD(P)/FAD-dependent oxidoreductase n=1 Tax=Bradyrhizobium sp. CCGUVB14 TaxID=2949628 RepID=UPI0020B43CD8|nr:FAD-dependent oxidoreductase [Bradyrhizobium sp. CCGUVB14]MCP3446091.1 FAD-dependent oxidoreductase [Bradyrhizobium sp. CCGUVB14]